MHLRDWLAICLSVWNAGTGTSMTTPCPSSLPTSSRGSAVCKNCPWRGREGGSGLLSSTLDMCPSSSSSQPQSLALSLSHSPLPAFLPAGPPVSHDLSVCGSLASLRLAGDLSVWMECWNRYLNGNSLSELSPDQFQGLSSLRSLSVGRQGGRERASLPPSICVHPHHPHNPQLLALSLYHSPLPAFLPACWSACVS